MSFHHSPRIVTDGLVLYLDAGNPKSYPGSGTDWFNLIDTTTSASFTKTPTFETTTTIGNFTGNGNYSAGTYPYDNSNTEHTYTIAFKCGTENRAGLRGLWRFDEDGSYSFVYLQILSDGKLRSVQGTGATNLITDSTIAYDDDNWHIATFRIKVGDELVLYVDSDKYVGSTLTSKGTSQNSVLLLNDGGNSFIGEWAYIMFYNRGLSEQEVLQNFNALRGRFGI